MKKKKILIFLPGTTYLKYLHTDAFRDLKKDFRIVLALNHKRKKTFENKYLKKIDYFYSIDKFLKNFIIRYLDLIRIRTKKIIPSFKVPLYFRFPSYKFFLIIYNDKKNLFPFMVYLKKFYFRSIFYKILSRSFFFILYKKFTEFLLNKNNEINKIIELEKPNLIIYPTHFIEADLLIILKKCEKDKINNFFIIENWDNLTTKAAISIKPKNLGVWGRQSKNHALDNFNYNSKNVFPLGNCRIHEYFKFRKKNYKNLKFTKKPYFLFLGTNVLFREEINFLKKLDSYLADNGTELSGVYRIHPQLSSQFINEAKTLKFKKILVDNPINQRIKNTNKSDYRKKFQHKEYFPLIKNAEFLIGLTVTTVTLEGFIFGKDYYLINTSQSDVSNMINNFSNYYHGIEKINLFHKFNNYDLFFKHFQKLLHNKNVIRKLNQTSIDKKIDYFYFNKNKNYSQNLNNIIKKII
jgi:hypothetical protein